MGGYKSAAHCWVQAILGDLQWRNWFGMEGTRSQGCSDFRTELPQLPRLCGRAAPMQPLKLEFFSTETREWVPKPELNVQLGALGIAARLLSSAVNHSGLVLYSKSIWLYYKKHKMRKEEQLLTKIALPRTEHYSKEQKAFSCKLVCPGIELQSCSAKGKWGGKRGFKMLHKYSSISYSKSVKTKFILCLYFRDRALSGTLVQRCKEYGEEQNLPA